MPGVDVHTCPKVESKDYIISQSHLRLLSGDACLNVSRLINDTDGRGNSTLPHSRWLDLPKWAVAALALLVGWL